MEEHIEQTLNNLGLAEAIEQKNPLIRKEIALSVINAMADVIIEQCAESHAVQVSTIEGEVVLRIHHDAKLETKDEKGRSAALTLDYVKKYIDPEATELLPEHVRTSDIVIRAAADVTRGFTQRLRAKASMERASILSRRFEGKEDGGSEQPGDDEQGGGTTTPPAFD